MALVRQTVVDKHFGFGGGPFKFSYNSESRVLKANMSGTKAISNAVGVYPKAYQPGVTLALQKAERDGDLREPTEDTIRKILKKADRYGAVPDETHEKAVAIMCDITPRLKKGKYVEFDEDAELFASQPASSQVPKPQRLKKQAVSLVMHYKVDDRHKIVHCVGSNSELTGGKVVMEPILVPAAGPKDTIATIVDAFIGKGVTITTEAEIGQVVFGGRMIVQFKKPLNVDQGNTVGNVAPEAVIIVKSGDGEGVEVHAWFGMWSV